MTKNNPRRVLITGASGFIGKNLGFRLSEHPNTELLEFIRGDSIEMLNHLVMQADAIIHLAGENRPSNISDFTTTNIDLTSHLCKAIKESGRNIPMIFTSSTQAEDDNLYGKSKLTAEQLIKSFVNETQNSVLIYRLPGVFGKWSKPNYNSVVATFCFNIARSLEIHVSDESTTLDLVYIDDLVDDLLTDLTKINPGLSWGNLTTTYNISLGELAAQIFAFRDSRFNLISERVGNGLVGALYSTFVSFLPTESFCYDLPNYADERGNFVEFLKTKDSGQFSFLTINPGITRGSHYHHSKTEKFIVVQGKARLRFRHLVTKEIHEINLSDAKSQIVDTIPGWVHDVTNIGSTDVVILLWANENFDREYPDTIAEEV